jgi:hypothetical protein
VLHAHCCLVPIAARHLLYASVSDETETSSASYSESDSRPETEVYLSYGNKSSDFDPDFEYEPPPPLSATSSLITPYTQPPAIKDHCITARV